MKYPVGTVFHNKNYGRNSWVSWIRIVSYETANTVYVTISSVGRDYPMNLSFFENDEWEIEYPKENLFTKLYLTLKSK